MFCTAGYCMTARKLVFLYNRYATATGVGWEADTSEILLGYQQHTTEIRG